MPADNGRDAYGDRGAGGGGGPSEPLQATNGMSIEEAYYANANFEAKLKATIAGGYTGPVDEGPKGNPRAWPKPGDSQDGRFLLPFVAMPDQHKKKFSCKIGRLLYFAADVTVAFKGWFSAAEHPMACFVTPHSIWFGDPKTGELVICRHFQKMRELILLAEKRLAILGHGGKEPDVVFSCTSDADRGELAEVIRKITRSCGNPLQSVRSLDKDAAKSFRNGVTYVNPKDCVYEVVEDPRTGQELVEVPERQVPYYAPLVPKIMHWFGGVFHITKDWKGGLCKDRRGCWVTATCVFLSLPDGPQSDGRDIRRCVGIEYIGLVLLGQGGELGISVNGGPKQPDLAIVFDNIDIRDRIVHILRECYYLRARKSLNVQNAQKWANELHIDKEKDFRPQLFVMKTRMDLYGLLREPSPK